MALLVLVLVVGGAASAQSLEVLGPRALAPPEGFLIAVSARDANGKLASAEGTGLEVEGGAHRPAPPMPPLQTYLVMPAPGAREVKVRVRRGPLAAQRTFKLGPPSARVSLALDGRVPVKGQDTSATLVVKLVDAHGRPDDESPPPVLRPNVGIIGDVTRVAAGEYRARYVLPVTRYPEVAVIVAFAPWPHPSAIHGAVGSLLVPLASSIDLPGRTEPNAKMSIEIAGVTYGPVSTGSDGRFSLPVVVPPGHRFGRGLAVDAAGNERRSKVDLRLPPTDQLACVVIPRTLPADGVSRARVVCATSDPYGKPARSARIELGVSAGTKSGRRTLGDGLYEWIYSAPSQPGGKPVELRATWRDGRNVSREDLQVSLVQGAAERLEVATDETVVHYGGQAELSLRVEDGLGRPREGATVEVKVPSGLVALRSTGVGRYRAVWTPPEDGAPQDAPVHLRAYGPAGSEPGRLTAWREGEEVLVGLTDLGGWPVPGQQIEVGEREVTTGPDGAASLGALAPGQHELRHALWRGLALTLYVLPDGRVWPQGHRPGSDVQTLPFVLAPPVPVNVRLRVAGREVTYWVEDPKGRLLPGRKVAVNVSEGEGGAPRTREGRTSFTLRGARAAQVSVTDLETGVTAIAEVPP